MFFYLNKAALSYVFTNSMNKGKRIVREFKFCNNTN